jgi:ABC-type phosphate transport system auxiliary subunit
VAVRALEDEVTALRASQRRHELAADLHAKERARLTCEIETLGAEAVRLRRDRNAAEREAEGAREKLRTAQRKAYELGEEVVRLRGGTMRGQPVRDLLRLEDE